MTNTNNIIAPIANYTSAIARDISRYTQELSVLIVLLIGIAEVALIYSTIRKKILKKAISPLQIAALILLTVIVIGIFILICLTNKELPY